MRFRKWDRIWICKNRELTGLADCHLHFEGSLPADVVEELARRAGDPLGEPGPLAARRASVTDSAGFLALFADVCRLFRSPEDYSGAAARLSRALAKDGVAYAEVYVSPEICRRIGLDPEAAVEAVDAGFASSAAEPDAISGSARHRAAVGTGVRGAGSRPSRAPATGSRRRIRDGRKRKARFPQRPSPVPTPARGRWD